MSKPLRRWTPNEDSILREHVHRQSSGSDGKSINWNDIAKVIPGRSNKDCRKRYFNEVTGGLKKGPWSEDEDVRLESFVKHYGMSWALIAQKMGTRSADQCSKRWQHCLDPKLDHSSWTEQENQCLLAAVERHGTSWKEIQTEYFPLRSANNVKNQFTILERKSLKSTTTTRSETDNTGPVMSDFDMLGQELGDFPDLQNAQFSEDFSFPTGDFDGSRCTDNMDIFTFDTALEDNSQPQHHDNGFQMEIPSPRGTPSRRPSQINALPTPQNSVSSSCPLARLGSRVPALATSNMPHGGSSNNNSNPITPPFTPTRGTGASGLSPRGGSPCNVGGPSLSSSRTDMASICPTTLTQSQVQQNPQASSSPQITAIEATIALPGTEIDWTGLQPQISPSTSVGGSAETRGGTSTPGKGTRTTITLEDAEPGTLLDVMKVLVSSNARVKFQTE